MTLYQMHILLIIILIYIKYIEMEKLKILCKNAEMIKNDNDYKFKPLKNNVASITIKSEYSGHFCCELEIKKPIIIIYKDEKKIIETSRYINLPINNKTIINMTYITGKIKLLKCQFILEDYLEFNWKIYRDNYNDLKDLNNKKDLWIHWCKIGKLEKRTYKKTISITPVNKIIIENNEIIETNNLDNNINNDNDSYEFNSDDFDYYSDDNLEENINQNNNTSLEESVETFDWEQYLKNYDDLRNKGIKTKEEAWSHWFYTGKNEGRSYKDINFEQTIKENEKENIETFDWEQYLKNYDDLRNAGIKTKEEAWSHWFYTGKNEGRSYKDIYFEKMVKEHEKEYKKFNWKQYLENYDDLRNAGISTKKDAWKHWFYTGKNEGRSFNKKKINILEKIKGHEAEYEIFNWRQYLENYDDLISAGINTKEEAWCHWIDTGKKEGRLLKKNRKEILGSDITWENYLIKIKKLNNFNKIIIRNKITHHQNNNFTYLHEDDIVLTRHFKIAHNFIKIDPNELNLVNKFILVIDFNNGGGGTTFFLNTIISRYKFYNTFVIARNYNEEMVLTINDDYELDKKFTLNESIMFLDNNKNKIDKIFINHTMFHNNIFLEKIHKLNKEIIFITHDYYSICSVPQPLIDQFKINFTSVINKYNTIITQNKNNLLIFNNYIVNKNVSFHVSELPDYKEKDELIDSNNKKIVVGIIGIISDIKGRLILRSIFKFYLKNKNIEFVVFGLVNIPGFKNYKIYKDITELNELLKTYKPNILLELSMWPETYSYTLSLAMVTDLPILYIKKTGRFTVEERLSHYPKAYPFDNINELNELILKHKQDYFYTILPHLHYNQFWDNLFNKNNNKIITNNINYKHNLKIFPIYFPQFHTIKENNISFYENYNDVKNLDMMPNKFNKETPNLQELNINSVIDYDLTNINIIQKQLDIINDYGLGGFSIYYYWFSKNTITNNNMIMEKVINLFFDDSLNMYDKKVFFIWANENWSSNPAFGSSTHLILNEYNEYNCNLNINNLLYYFKHKNYLKIKNKPVFLLHHPWFANNNELSLFSDLLEKRCKESGFDGVEFVVNSMNGYNNNYKNYDVHFNYKKTKSAFYCEKREQIYMDYAKYIDDDINHNNNIINTIAFDFDNRARLFKPNKAKLATICVKNCEFNKIRFIKKIQNQYRYNHQSKILLINAWNEWGEKMTLEPSNENNYYYLNLILEYLT
jgi:hypothetical protein